MKIAVIGNYGVGNIGDEAILSGLRKMLEQILPHFELSVMGKESLLPFGLRSCVKALISPIRWQKLATRIKEADIVVLGGGGLFTDEEKAFVGAFWSLQGIAALYYKKPLLILGVSVGKMSLISRFLTKFAFNRAKLITVRDQQSVDLLDKWGIKAHLAADLALFNEPNELQKMPNTNKYIVVSLRNFKNKTRNLHKKIARLCDFIIGKYGFNIELLPFEFGEDKDMEILNKVFDLSINKNRIIVHPYYSDLNKIFDILQSSEGVLAMRLHAGILALLCNRSVFVLSYMSKTADFWRELKNDDNAILSVNDHYEDLENGLRFFIEKILTNSNEVQNCYQIITHLRNRQVDLVSNELKTIGGH